MNKLALILTLLVLGAGSGWAESSSESLTISTSDDSPLTFNTDDDKLWQYIQFKHKSTRKAWMGLNPNNDFYIHKENGGGISFSGGIVKVNNELKVTTSSDSPLTFNTDDDKLWQYIQFKHKSTRKAWMGLNPNNDFYIHKENGGGIVFSGGIVKVNNELKVITSSDSPLTFNTDDDKLWQYIQFKHKSTRKAWMGLNPNNDFYIHKEEGGDIILSGGNVGIGTPNPGKYKLNVAGAMRADEIKVTAATFDNLSLNTEKWADYVCKDDYQLPSLILVEKFIQKNKHLPGIPSENEVKEKGMNMAEMMVKQMQKIEELTLYLIEQNKKLKEQNEKMAKLEKHNISYQNRLSLLEKLLSNK